MGEETEKQQQDKQSTNQKIGFFRRIFYHPNFGATAGIVGILAAVFGIYTYYASIREPNLTYYISPTRTPIVQKGNLNDFAVTLYPH
jgi:succinate-acetate transporter protein